MKRKSNQMIMIECVFIQTDNAVEQFNEQQKEKLVQWSHWNAIAAVSKHQTWPFMRITMNLLNERHRNLNSIETLE